MNESYRFAKLSQPVSHIFLLNIFLDTGTENISLTREIVFVEDVVINERDTLSSQHFLMMLRCKCAHFRFQEITYFENRLDFKNLNPY